MTEWDDGLGDIGTEYVEHLRHHLVVIGVHQDLEWKVGAVHGQCAQDFKAAEVAADQDAAGLGVDLFEQGLGVVDLDVEQVFAAGEQIDAIKDGGCETMKMTELVGQCRWSFEHFGEILF